jgi:hypothetical protein
VKLSAVFENVPLPGDVWIQADNALRLDQDDPWAPTRVGPWGAHVDGYEVTLSLILDGRSIEDQRTTYRAAPRLSIRVTRDQEEQPPPVVPHRIDGKIVGRDTGARAKYFAEIDQGYKAAAKEAVDRMMHYLSYEERIPGLGSIQIYDLANPSWEDAEGQNVSSHTLELPPSQFPSVVSAFPLARESALLKALGEPRTEPNVELQLLVDAKTALTRGHLRRATIEAASAVEIAIKTAVGLADTEGSRLLGFLRKKNIRPRLEDYLDGIPKHVWGVGFCDKHPKERELVRELIGSRHRSVHSGKCEKQTQAGVVDATQSDVASWLEAAETFVDWCASLNRS